MSTFAELQNEICMKFFNTPLNYTASEQDKVLYVSNPHKVKNCPPQNYDFSKTVVDMPIGYKCLNKKEIARIVVDMLRASIDANESPINIYDLLRIYNEKKENHDRHSLLTPTDRNYINANYHFECGALSQRPGLSRRSDDIVNSSQLTTANIAYYEEKMWPLGIVMYGVDRKMREEPSLAILKHAMATIELSTCIVFQEIVHDDVLTPRNFVWFSSEGEDVPNLGFMTGNQTVRLESVSQGVPGHKAHALNMLIRILGVPMMSNRYDRDNYVIINWKRVEKGKEHYLEKAPMSAWLQQIPYDFSSATHAPANYLCDTCSDTSPYTVEPVQDHLWQKTLSMGHTSELSETDKHLINILYGRQCQSRFLTKN
ncbi:astacin-like metalloprotease toxin 1 [Aphomia sociella]